MPVIGRLDEQVDDVLITPLSERRRDEQPPREDEVPTARRDDTPVQAPTEGESFTDADELPVWLL